MNKNEYPSGSIPCLDHGFIYLVDSMGGDDAIVQAARVSYGKGTKKTSEDRGLIRYLMRHRHTTPFEMVDFKFHCKMPIFVARQWVRHRTASINEYSLRYSEAQEQFYIPDPENIQFQSDINKQGRGEKVSEELKRKLIDDFNEISRKSFELYSELNEAGIARELARSILPVNLYTEWYWKNDLHNTFHFLKLRMDSHAQYEIRVYAEAMAKLVQEVCPIAYEAFEDYMVHGMLLTQLDRSIFKEKLNENRLHDLNEDAIYRIVASLHASKPRTPEELYNIYQKNGGLDTKDFFELKWETGGIEPGNIRELREFKEKLEKIMK